MSRRKSRGHWRTQHGSGEADTGSAPGKGSSHSRSLPGLQHSRECPRLEEQGFLELNHVRIQLEVSIVNDSTDAKLHLTAALLQDSVSWFWVSLDHLQTGQGRITEQSPESQTEEGVFRPPKSAVL